MFTNIAHHQPSHHFPHSLQYTNQDHYKESPLIPPLPGVALDERHNTLRHGIHQPRLQKPQQYAHPLQRPVSLSRQELSSNICTPKLEASEHMLRRKTPNGTLAAGYDGRPVEWTARPHAVKHFVMPMSPAMGETRYQSHVSVWPSDNSLPADDQNLAARDEVQRRSFGHGNAIDKSNLETAIPVKDRRYNIHSVTGLDSVLNQGSTSHQYGNMAGDQPIHTILQPMWPPCIGLTSLNDPGPYGPYWPDGALVPYRPAPVRDPRHPTQIRDMAVTGASPLQSTVDNRGECNISFDQPSYHYDMTQEACKLTGSIDSPNAFPNAPLEDPNQSKMLPYSPNEFVSLQHQTPLAHRGKPQSSRRASEQSHSSVGNSSRTPSSGHSLTSQPLFQKSTFHASHVQFKDRVLIWAHKVYVNLLASMHHSRITASAGPHHVDRKLQSTIYPKPPRQPSLNLSKSFSYINQNQENLQSRMSASQENIATSSEYEEHWQSLPVSQSNFSDDHLILTQSSLMSPYFRQNRNFLQTWQPNEHRNHSPYPAIPHIQTESMVPPSTNYQHEVSPSSAAATALEMLERLCQESGWVWTDGMLLGGCLAYGLGDHTKAMKWYMKVLSCDPK